MPETTTVLNPVEAALATLAEKQLGERNEAVRRAAADAQAEFERALKPLLDAHQVPPGAKARLALNDKQAVVLIVTTPDIAPAPVPTPVSAPDPDQAA
jgi:hypothetical protein